MPQQKSLDEKIRQLQHMAENIAWNHGSGRKHKVSDSFRGEFHYSSWDVAFANSDGDLHITSKGSVSLNRLTSSKTTIKYKGEVMLNVDDENKGTLPIYISRKDWEEKLRRLYYGG